MNFDSKMVENSGCLEIVVTGPYDLDEAIQKFPQVLEYCRHAGITCVLVDYSALPDQILETEIIIYTYRLEESYREYRNTGGHEVRFAFVGGENMDHPAVELIEKGDLPFRLFYNWFEAFEWLNVDDMLLSA